MHSDSREKIENGAREVRERLMFRHAAFDSFHKLLQPDGYVPGSRSRSTEKSLWKQQDPSLISERGRHNGRAGQTHPTDPDYRNGQSSRQRAQWLNRRCLMSGD